jgi:filamentous hemagglutinin
MDVRQFAFVASQPSAAVKSRESFLGMPKRGLAFLLANVMFWQPMWAQADGIVVADPNTSLDRAGNGVPIINIATPNGSGLSHNQFHDYNVGAAGVILNNVAAQTGQTQLGGIIVGNPHLTNRIAAQAILNEVISGNPTQLRGYTEVAGQSARVIVANPYGITCNGCGFINAPRVTLTTGKPVLDNGWLDRFQVDQGAIAIEGEGLNASNVDRFEIITRSARINAQIQAQNLTIVAGRNDVNAQTLNATARADDGSAKPQLAIDSSALGGMYAGAIKLVGTEAGVGVKLDGKLIASGGDIQLNANGQLSLADTAATGAVVVKAASLDARGPVYAGTALNVQTQGNLTNRQTLAARDNITLSAGGQLTNGGAIEAGVNADGSRNANGDLSLTAQNLDNSGKSLVAGRNLTINTAQTLNNQGGTLSAKTIAITAGTLDNRNSARVLASTALNATANRVFNTKGLINSAGNLTGTLGQLDNGAGEVSSKGVTWLKAVTVNNHGGQILGDLGLDIDLSGALDNRDGVLGSGRAVSLKAASLDNRDAGVVVSDSSLTVRVAGLLDNRDKGEISAKGAIDLHTGALDNRGGKVIGKSTLALRSDTTDNRAGVVQADQQMTLNVDRLDNRDKGVVSGKSGITYAGSRLDNSGGLLSAIGPVSLTADEVQNASGRISSQNDLTATIGLLQQQGGAVVAQGNLSLTGKTLDNRNGGLVGTTKALTLAVDDIDNRTGEISSSELMNIKGLRLDNSDGGKVLAGSDLELQVATLINQSKGLIAARGATTLLGTTLDNSGGDFSSLNALSITLDEALLNGQGFITSEGTLTVDAGRIDNSAGTLGSAATLRLTSRAQLLNQAGSISTDTTLTLSSASLDNSQKGLISAKGNSRVDTGAFDNSRGGTLTSGASLKLTAGQVNNATGRIASQQALDVSLTGLDQQGGELFSKTDLTLDLNNGQLNNQQGLINAPGTLLLKNLNGVNNQGGEISSQQAFTLAAQDLDNSGGKLLSQQGLTVRIAQALNNVKGVMSGASLDSHSDSLNNQEGLISSRGELLLATDKALDNQHGTVIADAQLTLTAENLDNHEGSIAGKANASVQAKNLNNQNGQLIAIGALDVKANGLDNRQKGLLGASKAVTLTVGDLDNRGGEISAHDDVNVTGKKLDNSDGGQIFSGNATTLTVDNLLNRDKGLISADTRLTVNGQSLSNSGGELISQQEMRLTLDGVFDNRQGNVSSEAALTIKTAQLANAGGNLSSAGQLTLDSTGSVDNQGGKVVTDGALVVTSTSLDNRQQGILSGKGAVTVSTGDFDNSSGRLSSADALNLVAGQVTNGAAGSIGSQGALTASVTGLDQQGGKLFSNTSLSLDLNHGQLNNHNGLINAPGALLLKQLNGVNNRGGTISSGEALTLTAQSLDNSDGKLLSTQGLVLRVAAALDNVKGLIGAASIDARAASLNNSAGSLVSRGDLQLTVEGLLRNDTDGLISAAQLMLITSADLNNQSGQVLGGSAVTLNAMALNNRDGGYINSQGKLTVVAAGLDSSNDGEVSAKGDIDLTLTSLTQQGGRLLGESAVSIDLAGGDLDNQNGLLTSKGPLTLQHLLDLDNQSGEISSNLGFDLIARAVNNTAGKIISGEKLLLSGTSLVNQKGLLSGWQGLSVNGDNLDNRDSGTLSSKYADVSVDVHNALLNSGSGAVVAQGNLTVKAGSLDNSNKGNLSSAAKQTLTLGGALNNNQGGLIASAAALDIVSTAFTNAGGVINAQQAVNVTASRLDNSSGQIVGNGAMTLNLNGDLNNTAGKLAGAGPVVITGVTDLRNQNGQLASQNSLNVRTGSLDNSNKGTIAANDQLQINATGTVSNNADGLIYSQKADVQLKAASLLNGKGSIQSDGALTLEVNAGFDNQSGKVIAQKGNVLVTAASIDNRGGILSSLKGALEARTAGVLLNGFDLNNNRQGGIIQAQGLTLSALAGLSNNGGRISAQATDASITTAALDNRNGVLYAKGLLGVVAASLDNTDGQIAGNRIDLGVTGVLSNRGGIAESDTQLSVKAASVDNQNGRLRALGIAGKTDFQIGGLLDNRNGVLETANTDLTLNVGSFQNAGGQINHVGRGKFDISTANVMGAGGGITTGGLLELNANSWNNSSVIQAGRLSVNVGEFSQTASGQLLASQSLQIRGGNWTNDGLIASDGIIDMQLGGSYGGNGRLSSVGDISLGAAQLTLNAASSIASGGNSQIKIGGLLNNAGRLTSNADLTVEAGSLNNTGTLGGSQSVTLKTLNLVNDRGLIFSGQNTRLEVSSLTNNYGDFYSLGDLTIKGYNGAERASLLENISGTMESVGNMSINATTLNNRGDKFEVSRKLVSGFIATKCNDCSGDTYSVEFGLKEIYEGGVSDQSPGAKLTSGGNFTFNGGDFLNSRSEVVAARDISINATNFSNIGASAGTIERTRIYSLPGITDGTYSRFMRGDVFEYNQRNDDGPLTFHYMDNAGQFRTGTHALERFYQKGSEEVRDILVDSQTGLKLMMYGAYQHPVKGEASEYDPSNLLSIPATLANLNPVSDTEVSRDGGTVQNAVVQAGGKVNITATQNLTNSVIHQDYGFSAGIDRRQNTQGGGTGKPLLVHLNSQLPPDLSQQQVNPLSLPGFSLPAGENGLFRLSGQGASGGSAGNGATPSPTWTVSSEVLHNDERLVAGTVGGPRDVQVEGPTFVSTSERAVDPVHHTGARTDGSASTFDAGIHTAGLDLGSVPKANGGKAAVDPRSVSRVTGLPDIKAPDNRHKYLIETNPVLTNLTPFMSSDYLLSKLGYDPDISAKRLGDGLYEQRLVQQAVVARTGQRYIDGQTSDEGLFKYLMNNAVASKDQLNLSLGVTLTAQQVAALTHDIVWLEEHEVNGEKVLVPVLYLANANNRLAPNGALIQGSDVTLIAGENLENQGTLRATNNLSATAGKDLVNSGLIEAGGRVDLLASENLVNKAGGIITGRDVDIVAVKGDVINERTVTAMDAYFAGNTRHQDYVDAAARVEAVNDLTMKAGRDVVIAGAVQASGRDMLIEAGRDVSILSVEDRTTATGARFLDESIKQLSTTIDAGRDLKVESGRNIAVIASDISAIQNISMTATQDILFASAADEGHTYSKSRTTVRQEDHVHQVQTIIEAGGNISLSARDDMTLIASRITAGDEAYLIAGDQLNLLSAQDSDHSLYDMKKKGSWGSKKTQRDEVTSVTNIGTQITTGGDLTLVSVGDQRYQAAELDSGDDLSLLSGGSITFEGVKDLKQESHDKSRNSFTWNSAKGRGTTDETLRQSDLTAEGKLLINAVNGLNIDIKQIDQNSVSQTIDAMVKADPELAWLKDAEARGDVDWRLVKETHDSYKYSSSGMGPGAMLAVMIIVTVLTAGAASGAVGTASGAMAGSGSTMAAATTAQAVAAGAQFTAAGWGNIMVSSVLTSMASTASISLINNQGDLGAVFKDLLAEDSLKNYLTGAATAGFTSAFLNDFFGVKGIEAVQPQHGFNLSTLDGMMGFTAYSLSQGATQAAISTALNGGSLGQNLGNALAAQAGSSAMAIGFKLVGDYVSYPEGSPQKILAHAIMGGLLSKVTGSDFTTGAAAAGLNQAMINVLASMANGNKNIEGVLSQLTGILAASIVDGDLDTGAQIAMNATTFNRQLHPEEKALAQRLAAESNGKYTVEQIEAQLRMSFVKGTKVGPGSDIVATQEGMYDPDGNWLPLGNSGLFVQNFTGSDHDVVAYIKGKTDLYSWTLEAEMGFSSIVKDGWSQFSSDGNGGRDRLTGYPMDSSGGYRVPITIDGKNYTPRFYPCATAECIASGGNIDLKDPQTLTWIKAANIQMVKDVGTAMSWGAALGPVKASVVLSNSSMAASLLAGYLDSDLPKTVSSNVLSTGFEKFLVSKGIPPVDAGRVSNFLGTQNVWDNLVKGVVDVYAP